MTDPEYAKLAPASQQQVLKFGNDSALQTALATERQNIATQAPALDKFQSENQSGFMTGMVSGPSDTLRNKVLGPAATAVNPYAVEPFQNLASVGAAIGRKNWPLVLGPAGGLVNATYQRGSAAPQFQLDSTGRNLTLNTGPEGPVEAAMARNFPNITGAGRAIGGLAGGLALDPRNWPLLGSAQLTNAIARRAVSLGFSAMMMKGALDQAEQLGARWDSATPAERTEMLSSTGLSTLFAGFAGSHEIAGKFPVIKGETNAQVLAPGEQPKTAASISTVARTPEQDAALDERIKQGFPRIGRPAPVQPAAVDTAAAKPQVEAPPPGITLAPKPEIAKVAENATKNAETGNFAKDAATRDYQYVAAIADLRAGEQPTLPGMQLRFTQGAMAGRTVGELIAKLGSKPNTLNFIAGALVDERTAQKAPSPERVGTSEAAAKDIFNKVVKNEGPTAARLVKALNNIGLETIETHGQEGAPVSIRLMAPWNEIPIETQQSLAKLGKIIHYPEMDIDRGAGNTTIEFAQDVSNSISKLSKVNFPEDHIDEFERSQSLSTEANFGLDEIRRTQPPNFAAAHARTQEEIDFLQNMKATETKKNIGDPNLIKRIDDAIADKQQVLLDLKERASQRPTMAQTFPSPKVPAVESSVAPKVEATQTEAKVESKVAPVQPLAATAPESEPISSHQVVDRAIEMFQDGKNLSDQAVKAVEKLTGTKLLSLRPGDAADKLLDWKDAQNAPKPDSTLYSNPLEFVNISKSLFLCLFKSWIGYTRVCSSKGLNRIGSKIP